jgi:ABC-2 type transport system ATP-binding protein
MSQAVAAALDVSPGSAAVEIESLEYRYGERVALAGISFRVEAGEIFGLLGPNGGGKTTLFRILSTLIPHSTGTVRIFDRDLKAHRGVIRENIGVVFQHPSLDPKLTVAENLWHHGHLYGLHGRELSERVGGALARLGLADRTDDYVESLSGGLKRRVELAKGLLTSPQLLILDEPSTGLDPGARRDLWQYLRRLRDDEGATILVTTHLMEEAESCDRLAILDLGRIVSEGTPESLKRKIGGDVITIRSNDPDRLAALISERFHETASRFDDSLRLEKADGHLFVRKLVEAFPDRIEGISLDKPTLEDVFVRETGHRFWSDEA